MNRDTPWTRLLKAYAEQRKGAHRRCKLLAVSNSLCGTCQVIDLEYFFFGDVATSRRRAVSEASSLGTLAGVIERTVVHQLEYVRLWVLPSGYLDEIGNVSVALLESRGVANVDPEHPRLG